MGKVAILISTRNRLSFVKCLLEYYSKLNLKHKIYIGDSSDNEISEEILYYIENKYTNLDINYKVYENYRSGIADNLKVIENLTNYVSEDFISITGDDDYLIPRTVERCVKFLEENNNYISAFGNGKYIYFKKILNKNVIEGNYNIINYEQDSGLGRLNAILQNYSVLSFGVHRTSEFKKAVKNIETINEAILNELSLVLSLAILGKSKNINDNYIIRGIHPQKQILIKRNILYTMLDINWYHSYEYVINHLSKIIEKQDCISEKNAKVKVKEMFLIYLIKVINNQSMVKNSKNKIFARFKYILKSSYIIRRLYKTIKLNILEKNNCSIELKVLKETFNNMHQ